MRLYNKNATRYVGLFIIQFILALFVMGTSHASDRYDDMRADYEKRTDISGVRSDIEITKTSATKTDKVAENKELETLRALLDAWGEELRSGTITAFHPLSEETKNTARGLYEDDEKVQIYFSDTISLDPLIALALLRNPMILSAQARYKAAYERFSQVNNLDLIMRDYLAFTNTLSTTLSDTKGRKMVAMEFPFPGMTSLKGEIIDKDLTIGKLELERVRIKVITNLKKKYYELLYILHEEEITKKTLKLLKELEQVANVKYDTGKTSFNDVIKVQIKLEKLKDALRTIDERKSNVKVMILNVLSLPPDSLLGTPTEVQVTLDKPLYELYKIGRENNIDILIIAEQAKRMALMIEMAKKKSYPDFTMGYSYYNGEKIASANAEKMPGFMTSPMIDHAKNSGYAQNDAYIREVEGKLEAHILMQSAKSDEIIARIKAADYHIDKALREVRLYQGNLIKKSKESLEVARIGYETGRVSFLDTLDADMMWLNFNIEYYKAMRHILVSIAELESAASVSLAHPVKQ